MKTGLTFSALALSAAVACAAAVASAQDVGTRVAEESDWQTFVATDPKGCWAATAPRKSEHTRNGRPVKVNRGEIRLFVAFQPSHKVAGQVSFVSGYPFAKDSGVTLEIDGQKFELFSFGVEEDEIAWPASSDEDRKIVASMKRGAEAVVTALSSRGTRTRDTFSLIGATAMIEDAERRCGS